MLCFFMKIDFITIAYELMRKQYPYVKFGFVTIEYHNEWTADVFFISKNMQKFKVRIDKSYYNDFEYSFRITRI